MAHRQLLRALGLGVSVAVITIGPGSSSFAGNEDEVEGNGTGGGWVDGETPDYPPGHDADVAAKLSLWTAFDELLDGKQTVPEFRAVERRTSRILGIRLHRGDLRTLLRSVSSKHTEPCGPENPCPTEEDLLAVPHHGQNTNYFCGPASGVMIADFRNAGDSAYNGASLTQQHMGGTAHMETVVAEVTPYASNTFTKGLNRWLSGSSTGYYVQTDNPSVSTFKIALRYDITDNHPFGVSTVELEDEDTYNGHDTSNAAVGHWIVARGYGDYVAESYFRDPATTVWQDTNPSFHKPTSAFVTQYVDNGISG
jgi:hypothetical protein